MVAMGQAFIAEVYSDWIDQNPEQMAALLERLITSGDDSIVLVGEQDGRLTGMVGMVAFAHHISAERVAGEVFWYAAPDARGSTGIRLLKAAERWARERGAKVFQMIAPTAKVGQIYAALGFSPVETTYQKAL